MRTESRELLAIGIFSAKSGGFESSLGDRIEVLLRRGRTFSPRASTTGFAVSAAALGALTLAGSLAPRWIAFAQEPVHPSFEVASIKPSAPPTGQPILVGMVSDPNQFKGSFVTLLDLIARAYGIDHSRISGGPPWASSDHYEVIATLPQGTPQDRIPLLLQTLLAERFRLITRRDTRMTRVYALVPASGAPKLKRSEAAGTPIMSSVPLILGSKGALGICCGRAKLNKVSMERFAALLSAETDRPVQDATGIAGTFDISLEWTPEVAAPQPGPSIYTAVQERLGLRLEPRNAPLDYLAIEHVEHPSGN